MQWSCRSILAVTRPLLVLLPLLLAGCGGAQESGPAPGTLPGPVAGAPAPDFVLQDVNPNSATNLAMLSPRQQLTRISAWYFGHAT